jgi:hypothetical protein
VVLGKLDIHMWKTETRSYLSPCMKINSKWIKDHNIRPETLRLLEKNTSRQRHR